MGKSMHTVLELDSKRLIRKEFVFTVCCGREVDVLLFDRWDGQRTRKYFCTKSVQFSFFLQFDRRVRRIYIFVFT